MSGRQSGGKRRDLAVWVRPSGVRAFIIPRPLRAVERGGEQNRSEGREAGSWMREDWMEQENPGSAATAKQGRDATGGEPHDLWWAEASIWTDRMVSALGNGVKGGKWFSLIDKVVRPATLDIAWQRVARNKGAAGVDGQSIERFAAQSERYLQELQRSLTDGSYRPDPVKRVEIPKGGRQDPASGDTDGEGPDCPDSTEDGHRADL